MVSIKTTLLVNGISSGVTGALLVIFCNPVAALLGSVPVATVSGTGLFLLCFALGVLMVALKQPVQPSAVKLITLLDLTWVLTSLVVVLTAHAALSSLGILLILAVAAWVAIMAALQIKGLSSRRDSSILS